MVLLEMDKDNFKREIGRLKDILEQEGERKELSPIRAAGGNNLSGGKAGGGINMLARSGRNMTSFNRVNNRTSAPLGGLMGIQGLKKPGNLPAIGQINSAPPKSNYGGKTNNRQSAQAMPNGKINLMAHS